VGDLTRTFPSLIRFSLAADAPAPPMGAVAMPNRSYLIETFDLQADLKRLLDWAHEGTVDLLGLSAAPSRLDDVFRDLEAQPSHT
jgi:ABC-2 type transport system ATP-binding protein